MRSARSYLYVPGDQPQKLARATTRGADALVVDLEDAVLPAAKSTARAVTAAWMGTAVDEPAGPELWVRVNAGAVEEDVAAVAVPGVAGVFVPKAEPALLRRVDDALDEAERRAGLTHGSFGVIAVVETALGVLRAEDVAASPRVVRLGVGEADLVGELGLVPGPDREELWPIRSHLVVASASADLPPPIGPVELAVNDIDRLRATTSLLLRQGFRARTTLAPRQVHVVNEVFTPTAQEVEAAQHVIDVLEAAGRAHAGVAVTEDGRFVDAATVRSAREVVSRAR